MTVGMPVAQAHALLVEREVHSENIGVIAVRFYVDPRHSKAEPDINRISIRIGSYFFPLNSRVRNAWTKIRPSVVPKTMVAKIWSRRFRGVTPLDYVAEGQSPRANSYPQRISPFGLMSASRGHKFRHSTTSVDRDLRINPSADHFLSGTRTSACSDASYALADFCFRERRR